MTESVAIRHASHPGDLAFFFSATLRANYLLSSTNRLIPRAIYFREHKSILERLLRRTSAQLLIACERDEPDFVLGFVLAEPALGILHFTYVKKALRRFGVMTRLMKAAEISLDSAQFTHWTFDIAAVLSRLKGEEKTKRRFNPYLLLPKVDEQ